MLHANVALARLASYQNETAGDGVAQISAGSARLAASAFGVAAGGIARIENVVANRAAAFLILPINLATFEFAIQTGNLRVAVP